MDPETVLYFTNFLQNPVSSLCGGVLPPVSSLAFSVWFFPEWTDGRLAIQWPAYLLLLLGVLINSLWNTAMMVPYAINRHMHIATYYILVYGVATLGMGFLGAANIGLSGAALALLLVEAAIAVVVIHVSLPMARIGMIQWVKIVLRPPFDLIGSASVCFLKRSIGHARMICLTVQ